MRIPFVKTLSLGVRQTLEERTGRTRQIVATPGYRTDFGPLQAAAWDLVNGLRRHEIWVRQSVNEVRRRYRRTILGPMWVTVSLVIFATVLSFVWSGLFQQNQTTFLPFLLSGLLPWTLIAASIGEGTGAFLSGEALIKSRQFPYTILTNIVLMRNVVIFVHNLLGYVLVAAVCQQAASWASLLVVPGLALVLLNCGWMCLMAAVFCLRYRDFQQLVASFLMIAVFVTPVFFNGSQIQGGRAIIVHANLLHHMVDIVRQPLLGNVPSATSYVFCLTAGILGWIVAVWLYARKRARLPYWF